MPGFAFRTFALIGGDTVASLDVWKMLVGIVSSLLVAPCTFFVVQGCPAAPGDDGCVVVTHFRLLRACVLKFPASVSSFILRLKLSSCCISVHRTDDVLLV